MEKEPIDVLWKTISDMFDIKYLPMEDRMKLLEAFDDVAYQIWELQREELS